MTKKSVKILLVITLTLLLIPSVYAYFIDYAVDSMDFFYESFYGWLDFFIFFLIFGSAAQVFIGKKFENVKGGQGLVLGLGLAMSLALTTWAHLNNYRLLDLGPVIIILLIIAFIVWIYSYIKTKGKSSILPIIGALILILLILFMLYPDFIDNMPYLKEILAGVIGVLLLAGFIYLISRLFKKGGESSGESKPGILSRIFNRDKKDKDFKKMGGFKKTGSFKKLEKKDPKKLKQGGLKPAGQQGGLQPLSGGATPSGWRRFLPWNWGSGGGGAPQGNFKCWIENQKTTYQTNENITINSQVTGGSGNYNYQWRLQIRQPGAGKWKLLNLMGRETHQNLTVGGGEFSFQGNSAEGRIDLTVTDNGDNTQVEAANASKKNPHKFTIFTAGQAPPGPQQPGPTPGGPSPVPQPGQPKGKVQITNPTQGNNPNNPHKIKSGTKVKFKAKITP